jgi:hypothetical protein
LAKLFDLQLAHQLSGLDASLSLDQSVAALNRAGFLTFTGRRWTTNSLKAARRHAAEPRPSRLTWIPGAIRPDYRALSRSSYEEPQAPPFGGTAARGSKEPKT